MRKKETSLFTCFIGLTTSYDSVDRTLLCTVLSRFGVPPRVVTVIRQSHDSMRACACRWMMASARKKACVLAPSLFIMFLTAVRRAAEKCFISDAAIMGGVVQLQLQRNK